MMNGYKKRGPLNVTICPTLFVGLLLGQIYIGKSQILSISLPSPLLWMFCDKSRPTPVLTVTYLFIPSSLNIVTSQIQEISASSRSRSMTSVYCNDTLLLLVLASALPGAQPIGYGKLRDSLFKTSLI